MLIGDRIAALWSFWFSEPLAYYRYDGSGGLYYAGQMHNTHGLAAPHKEEERS